MSGPGAAERPRAPLPSTTHRRLSLHTRDTAVVERASVTIVELGDELDAALREETRDAERLRLLRETTNRITRVANDAVHAYRRASAAMRTELDRPGADVAGIADMRDRLDAARDEVLRTLALAEHRYPAPEPPDPPTDG